MTDEKDLRWCLQRYTRSIVWSDKDLVYVATCPDLGVMTDGVSRTEALIELDSLIEDSLSVLKERGFKFPEPIGVVI